MLRIDINLYLLQFKLLNLLLILHYHMNLISKIHNIIELIIKIHHSYLKNKLDLNDLLNAIIIIYLLKFI